MIVVSQCPGCANSLIADTGEMVCLAFPNGIPVEIATGRVDHRRPFEGDAGIRYEPAEARADAGWEDVPRDEGGRWTGTGRAHQADDPALAAIGAKITKMKEAYGLATSPGVKAALTKKIKAAEKEGGALLAKMHPDPAEGSSAEAAGLNAIAALDKTLESLGKQYGLPGTDNLLILDKIAVLKEQKKELLAKLSPGQKAAYTKSTKAKNAQYAEEAKAKAAEVQIANANIGAFDPKLGAPAPGTVWAQTSVEGWKQVPVGEGLGPKVGGATLAMMQTLAAETHAKEQDAKEAAEKAAAAAAVAKEAAELDAQIAKFTEAYKGTSSPGVKAAITKKMKALELQKTALLHAHGVESVSAPTSTAKAAPVGELGPNWKPGKDPTPPGAPQKGPLKLEHLQVARSDIHTFLGYTDAGKHHQAVAKAHAQWRSSLPYPQNGALGSYQGSGYDDMNVGLRKNIVEADNVGNKVRELTKALASAPPLEHDLVVYRGFRFSKLAQDPVGYLAAHGNRFTDQGFVSTSVHSSKAMGFSGSSPDGSVLVRIRLPKGTRSPYLSGGGGGTSEYEWEQLVQRDATFEITRAMKTSDGFTVLDAVYVGSSPQGLSKRGAKADAQEERRMRGRAAKFVWGEGDVVFHA